MAAAGQEIRVRRANWREVPREQKFELSDMDHTMPKIFVPIVEVFELPDGADKEEIVATFRKGLEFALTQYPVVNGSLHMDEGNGRLCMFHDILALEMYNSLTAIRVGIVTKRTDTVSLFVEHLDRDDGEEQHPSFQELAERHFPASELLPAKLLPKVVTEKMIFSPVGQDAKDGLLVATFQITFIRGGFILGLAMHHSITDAPGCDGFLTTWAENSTAAKNGSPFRPIDDSNRDRSRLSAPKPPSAERWKQLDGKFTTLKDVGGPTPPPPADFVVPPITSRTWHLSSASLEQLKADASPVQGPGNSDGEAQSWISTYDAVMALFWKTMTRAKIPLLKPSMDDKSSIVHPANARSRLDPPLPSRYLGNGCALPRAGPLPVGDLIEADLRRLAPLVRQGIKEITPQYTAEMPEWVAGLRDRRWITVNMSNFLGLDLAGTSWQGMEAYQKHDFGFGLPVALRWPNPSFEGYVFIFPQRSGVKGAAPDEGLEVCVCLEAGSADRLLKDEELLKYAEARF